MTKPAFPSVRRWRWRLWGRFSYEFNRRDQHKEDEMFVLTLRRELLLMLLGCPLKSQERSLLINGQWWGSIKVFTTRNILIPDLSSASTSSERLRCFSRGGSKWWLGILINFVKYDIIATLFLYSQSIALFATKFLIFFSFSLVNQLSAKIFHPCDCLFTFHFISIAWTHSQKSPFINFCSIVDSFSHQNINNS